MNTAFTYILASLVAFILAASCNLDGPNDIQAAQDVADEAGYAAALADGGVAQCAALGRVPLWSADGDLICRLPRSVIAQGDQP